MPRSASVVCFVAFVVLRGPAAIAQGLPKLSAQLAGSEFTHTVTRGDSLSLIGSRFGVEVTVLAKSNGLAAEARLKPGQVLKTDNRHIVPQLLREGILINIPQRMLFYFSGGQLVSYYPVGLGRPDWPTPTDQFKVISKEENPVWDVPKSIQEEMRRERKAVKERVAPGPDNPLGKYWIGITPVCYGIHGTIAPTSVYRFSTHGCIRLHPDDIFDLYQRVSVGTPGAIIYEPLLLAETGDQRLYIEVHRDVYRRSPDLLNRTKAFAAASGLSQRLDWRKVESAIRMKEGVAREVTQAGSARAPNVAEERLSRRGFLRLGALALVGSGLAPAAMAGMISAVDRERSLAFYNTHTGETLRTVYWAKGEYLSDALAGIARILRDHRTNEIRAVNLRLLDLLHAIRLNLETREPFHIISGYRSPQTNALLRSLDEGIAGQSLHMEGKAIDVRLPDRELSSLRQVAVELRGGGVGYYPRSDFIHVDIGRVRTWRWS